MPKLRSASPWANLMGYDKLLKLFALRVYPVLVQNLLWCSSTLFTENPQHSNPSFINGSEITIMLATNVGRSFVFETKEKCFLILCRTMDMLAVQGVQGYKQNISAFLPICIYFNIVRQSSHKSNIFLGWSWFVPISRT